MDRRDIARICEQQVLSPAAQLYGTSIGQLSKFDDFEGCANLVYWYIKDGEPRVLRLSYRPDRTLECTQAELHFVNYLAERGVHVAKPIPSINGNLTEVIQVSGIPFIIVSFQKGRGMRVPDNGYRYREGVPIEEYFYNWGRVLGQMHRLTKCYQPLSDSMRRPEWYAEEQFSGFPAGDRLPQVHEKYERLINELRALPKSKDSYGLIHFDFNDGNFTVDYDNGDITVFDFDDSCYFWLMYDIACAWEGGIGRAMYRPLADRIAFMDHYMERLMAGYSRENTISAEWMVWLPLFLRLIQMMELMHFSRYLDDPDEEIQAQLRYRITCIEQDIPYMGFFDQIFDPGKPFSL
jgi:Ser/Thr protein kinase RdoA (MazF antagonist)